MKKRASFFLFTFCAAAAFAAPFDWPQWQGPDRTGISKEAGLLKEWPKDGPPMSWKITGLGGGYSTPSIADGQIFGMSDRGDDEVAWALSESDGKTLWVTRIGQATFQQMPQAKEGPGCTPTVDGGRLYVETMAGDIACLEAKDGKIVWQRSMKSDFGGHPPVWSYRESPLVDGDKVVYTPGSDDAMLVALDKHTGKTIWKSQLPHPPADTTGAEAGDHPPGEHARGPGGPPPGNPPPGGPGGFHGPPPGGFGGFGSSGAAYSSPIAINFDGQREYVQFTAKALVGVAAADGKFLWRYNRAANPMGINCSTPIYEDGMVFAASAYGAGGGLVKLSKDANGAMQATEVYLTKKMQNHHGGMILLDGFLYGANGGNEGGALVCLDFKTGDVRWNERDDADHRAPKGSVTLADGRLYYRTEKGTMLLIEPNSKQYVELGRFEQPNRTDQPAWAHPVIANGKLYLRDQDTLFCYDVKARKS